MKKYIYKKKKYVCIYLSIHTSININIWGRERDIPPAVNVFMYYITHRECIYVLYFSSLWGESSLGTLVHALVLYYTLYYTLYYAQRDIPP